MKKTAFILLNCLIALSNFAQQKLTIYISTKLPITFRTYIEDELQIYAECSRVKISNVPSGEKKLKLRIMTPSNQQPTIVIGKSGNKEEYYKVEQIGDKYVIKSNPEGIKEDKTYYARGSYMPKPKPAVKDTNSKNNQSCHVRDSILNKFITDMSSLKDAKSRKDYAVNYMRRKCLYTHQIKSIGYRIDDDEQRLELYKILFQPALDRNKFQDLTNSFQSQLYANKFIDWFNNQKL
ncbi:MAG: hypothetical protein JNL75_08360 [Chitinophagales bacterium]|nr:hypothetical protein [Chitinophagales bacterium]